LAATSSFFFPVFKNLFMSLIFILTVSKFKTQSIYI
jgi:hypothetical protein